MLAETVSILKRCVNQTPEETQGRNQDVKEEFRKKFIS